MKALHVMILHAPTGIAGAEGVILNINRFVGASKKINLFNCPFINFNRGEHTYLKELEARQIPYEAMPLDRRFEYRYIRETQRLIQKYNIDVIHSHGYRADITAVLAAKGNVPIVSTIHGFTSNSYRVLIYEYLQRIILRHIHTLIPVSASIEEKLKTKGIKPDRIKRLGNVVDIQTIADTPSSHFFARLRTPKDVKRFLFVGRLSVEKGFNTLLDACRLLKQKQLSFFLTVIGDGPLKKKYEERVRDLQLNEEVFFTGFRRDVIPIMAAADIFILPSLMEGLPLVVLEAMAAGCPVVATRVGGLPQLIDHNQNGLLVSPGNPKELAEALFDLSHNPMKAKEMCAAAKERITKEYNPAKWAEELISIYHQATCN